MGNTFYTSSRRKITPCDLIDICNRVNVEMFAGSLMIKLVPDCEHVVTVGVRDDVYWTYWIMDSKHRIEYTSPRPGWNWIYWMWDEMSNALAREWRGRHSSDCEVKTCSPKSSVSFLQKLFQIYEHVPSIQSTQQDPKFTIDRFDHDFKFLKKTAPIQLYRQLFISEVVQR